MTDERANILARVREALQSTTPQPPSPAGSARDWLPEVQDYAKQFRANAVDLRAEFHLTDRSTGWLPILRSMNWIRPSSKPRLEKRRTKRVCMRNGENSRTGSLMIPIWSGREPRRTR